MSPDAGGAIESINPAASLLFEYTAAELKGSAIEKLFPVRASALPMVDQLADLTPEQMEAEAKNQDLIFTEVQRKRISNVEGDKPVVRHN